MRESVRSFLEFEWLTGLDPGWATGLTMTLYLALLLFGATRSADFIYEGSPDRRRRRDLRAWLVPVILAQILLYLCL